MPTTDTPTPTTTAKPKTPAKRPAIRGSKPKAAGVIAAASKAPPAAAGALPVELLDADHFTNPRGVVDESSTAFMELVASVRDLGVIEPIVVGMPLLESGRQPIVCGWRRYQAAILAKLPAVPVHTVEVTTEAEALAYGVAENVARETMSPLAEARSIDRLMKIANLTQPAAGAKVGMSERTVRERLRLLKIHRASPGVAEAIDAGAVPMDAAVLLQRIAEISPFGAEELVRLMNEPEVEDYSIANPDDVVEVLAGGSTYLLPTNTNHWCHAEPPALETRTSSLPLSPALYERWRAIPDSYTGKVGSVSPIIRFTTEDEAAAAEAGALLEIEHTNRWGQRAVSRFIAAGPEFFTDLLAGKLTQLEDARAVREHAEAQSKAAAKRAGKSGAEAGGTAGAATQAELEEKRLARIAEAQAREIAHHANVILGERATSEVFARVALSLPAAKMLALLVLEDGGTKLLSRGVRYTDAEYLTETPHKRGEGVTRIYALGVGNNGQTSDQPLKDLRAEIVAATTPEAAIAPVLRAYALAAAADESVVPESKRAWLHIPGAPGRDYEAPVREQLDALVAATGITDGLATEARQREALPDLIAAGVARPVEPATSPVPS